MQQGAYIKAVEPESPADDAGFYPGCRIIAVDGHPLRDIIDWRWYSCDDEVSLSYVDGEGDEGEVVLTRDEGQQWGFEFRDAIFDEVIECRNACIFCFMRQLPDDARTTLSLRDDDYRLSFLQGNFVTFTNMGPADELRVIEQCISPLRFSLHCISPDLRRKMIGANAAHGIEVAERLLAAGVQLHVQIVLLPGINDGEELKRTLRWCYAHENILNVGIVPLGYTKHQARFHESFNDPSSAAEVIESIGPFQQRAMGERGSAWVYAADEFYSNAYGHAVLEHIPPASWYGDFELFEDGIGIIRSFYDDWLAHQQAVATCAQAIRRSDATVLFVYGCAMRETFEPLVRDSPLDGLLVPLFVENRYFGGNVDVTGLLCGCDIVSAVREAVARQEGKGRKIALVAVPDIVFNADGVTLDDMTLEHLRSELPVSMLVVSCEASKYLQQIANSLPR